MITLLGFLRMAGALLVAHAAVPPCTLVLETWPRQAVIEVVRAGRALPARFRSGDPVPLAESDLFIRVVSSGWASRTIPVSCPKR
ncbi:MAG: hypothetical protein ACYCW6_09705 [Candidatus Xenobia bacterium]